MGKKRQCDQSVVKLLPDMEQRYWEGVFLKDDPDMKLESEQAQFKLLMDELLDGMQPDDLDLEERQAPTPRSEGMRGTRPPGKAVWDEAPELDLHGLTRLEALKAFSTFLEDQRRDGSRWIKVIVGKGHHSDSGKAVLRETMEAHLQTIRRGGLIDSWFWEKREKLKSGAVLIRTFT